jgi:hypothetical protein
MIDFIWNYERVLRKNLEAPCAKTRLQLPLV